MSKKNSNAGQFAALKDKYEKFRNDAPEIIAITAVNFFKRNFEVGGFVDKPFKRWKKPQNPKARTRATMVESGRLRRGIKSFEISRNRVVIGVGNEIRYASIHNYGGTIKITTKMRKFFWAKFRQTGDEYWKGLALTKKTHFDIPQRQFIGDSKALAITVDRQLIKEMAKRLKPKI